MHRVCVFAGSRDGSRREYAAAARALGAALARRRWGLVYGGSVHGTMGVLADAALQGGGEVQGVLPRAGERLTAEQAHPRLTQLFLVGSMHERKAKMHALSDGFVVLPGGFGTADETFEAVTWRQLGIHRKPIAFLDVAGYWQPLLRWVERAVAEGFVDAPDAAALHVSEDVERILDAVGPATTPICGAAPT
jgi:uncharacterized protein (TIGR00730 family)